MWLACERCKASLCDATEYVLCLAASSTGRRIATRATRGREHPASLTKPCPRRGCRARPSQRTANMVASSSNSTAPQTRMAPPEEPDQRHAGISGPREPLWSEGHRGGCAIVRRFAFVRIRLLGSSGIRARSVGRSTPTQQLATLGVRGEDTHNTCPDAAMGLLKRMTLRVHPSP